MLEMSVTNADGQTSVGFSAPRIELSPYRLQREAFAEEFGVPAELIDSEATIYADLTLKNVFIPTVSLDALGAQEFDFGRIRERFGGEAMVIFCFYSRETKEPESSLHIRGLAPNVGVDEDPVTGSMQAGLVLAAKRNGHLPADQEVTITEQGYFIGRPGRATITHDVEADQWQVSGTAVHVFSTTLTLGAAQ